MRRAIAILVLGAGVATALAACGGACGGDGEGRPIDWNRWFAGGRRLASLEEAARTEQFRLVVPDGLPPPRGIFSSGSQAIAFVYDLPGQGRVVILEGRANIPDRAEREAAYRRAARNGRSTALWIRDGAFALASECGRWAAIEWVEQGTQVSIQMREGSIDEAIQIANRL